MINRSDLQKIEDANIQSIMKETPEQFFTSKVVDDADRLQNIGIRIPNKDTLPEGYVKLWPEDFIVEEILKDNTICTIVKENEVSTAAPLNSQIFHATLVKCNLSTPEAVQDLSKILGCGVKQIGYAGIKDKNAITSQRISLKHIPFEKIRNIRSDFFFLKDIAPATQPLQNGDLQGNRFTILLRTQPGKHITDVRLKELVDSISHTGFPNFFYTQRFGSFRLRSHVWGEMILREEYEAVAKEFLTLPYEQGAVFYKNIRNIAAEYYGNWPAMKKVYEPFPIFFENELTFLSHMEKNPTDLIGGLLSVKEQVHLWLHAFASYLFNEKLSEILTGNTSLSTPELPFLYADQNFYEKELRKRNLFPVPTKPQSTFQFHTSGKTTGIKTHAPVTFTKVFATTYGPLLEFNLDKGSYATTLLATLCNLVAGPPQDFDLKRINCKQALGGENVAETFRFFAPIIGNTEDRVQMLSR